MAATAPRASCRKSCSGVGGVRLLRALGMQPSVFHMNEGHAAFLTLELIREKMAGGQTFAEALTATKAECIFTTHTPVEAGHDRFSSELMDLRRRTSSPSSSSFRTSN